MCVDHETLPPSLLVPYPPFGSLLASSDGVPLGGDGTLVLPSFRVHRVDHQGSVKVKTNPFALVK